MIDKNNFLININVDTSNPLMKEFQDWLNSVRKEGEGYYIYFVHCYGFVEGRRRCFDTTEGNRHYNLFITLEKWKNLMQENKTFKIFN